MYKAIGRSAEDRINWKSPVVTFTSSTQSLARILIDIALVKRVVSFMQRFRGDRLWISKHCFFQVILTECNDSDTRVPLGFMLSKIVTESLHLANQNYFARAV